LPNFNILSIERTALRRAAMNRHSEVVMLLIKSGADFTGNLIFRFKDAFKEASGINDYNLPEDLAAKSMTEFIHNIFGHAENSAPEDLNLLFTFPKNIFGDARIAAFRITLNLLTSQQGLVVHEDNPEFNEYLECVLDKSPDAIRQENEAISRDNLLYHHLFHQRQQSLSDQT
jgi:hypothetical protein